MFKRLLYCTIGLLFITSSIKAQVSAYAFTTATGTFTTIKGATGATSPTLTAVTAYTGAIASDDGYANNVTLPFTFTFNGSPYTKIGINSNGFIYLGATFPGATSAGGTNLLAGGSGNAARPMIAPLWDDHDIQANNNLNVLTTGTAPNRVFTVEWSNVLWQWGAASACISFQCKLYETTNVIEFIYQQQSGTINDSNGGDLGASIGLSATATGSGNFLSLNNASASPTASSTTETTTITTKPANGQIYRFTPPACLSGTFTTQPADKVICVGGNTTIPSAFTGTTVTVKWQVSTDGGTTYTDLTNTAPYSGVTTNTLTITGGTAALNGNLYKAVLSGPCTNNVSSTAAKLTVNTPAAIATAGQPRDSAACEMNSASFTVTATGTNLTYQWQDSVAGRSPVWQDISGATNATLQLDHLANSQNGYGYRCTVGNTSCTSVTSNKAVLTVHPLPTVSISAAPYKRLMPGLRTTLTAVASPAASTNKFTWYRDGIPVVTSPSATLLVDVDGMGDYTATVTDVYGCSQGSNTVTIADSVSSKLFIYPSPNTGQFQVRYYSMPGNNSLVRSVNIFDAKGALVNSAFYSVARTYGDIDIDLRRAGKGVYWIELGDMKGNRIAVGRVVVQ